MPTLVLLALLSCRNDADTSVLCQGATQQLWDPAAPGAELTQFPDDALSVDDPSSPTGLRLAVPEAWLAAVPEVLSQLPAAVNQRSGAARMGAIFLRFDGALGDLPADAEASLTSDALMLVNLDTGERQPYRAWLLDRGRQLQVQPLRPLRPNSRHALVLTDAHLAQDGACVAPSDALAALLTGGGDDPRLVERYGALADALGLSPGEISAATVFTTHDDVAEVAAVARALDLDSLAWSAPMQCSTWGSGRRCEGSFIAADHRAPGALLSVEPADHYELAVSAWLPAEPNAPFFLYGHGINSSRAEGAWMASRSQDLGVAVVTVDALKHGDHPTADDEIDAAAFIGLTLSPMTFSGEDLSHNFLQTNIDRLQLAALLQASPDLDGDGVDDLDPERMGYVGVSLGGLLGPSLSALSPELDMLAIPLAGGHLTTFATQNELVGALQELFIDLVGDEAAWERTLAVAQAAIDAADPATWAPHVLAQRLDDAPLPHLYFPVSTWDTVVPVATGEALARALEVPHVPPVVVPQELLSVSGAAPVAGNLDGVTAGFFQLDRVSDGEDVTPSAHDHLMGEDEGELQLRHFLQTWAAGDTPEIIDPYEELGTPSLP